MPKRLTKEELISKIANIDSNYKLADDYDFNTYKNNKSKIILLHNCGNKIICSWKSFMAGKALCSCEPDKHIPHKINHIKEKYLKNKTNGRGSYLKNDNYLYELFKNENDYKLIGNPTFTTNKMSIKVYHTICKTYFETTPNRFQQGQRCPYCANLIRVGALPGTGATKIAKYLQERNIFKENEVYIDDCKDKRRMPFDFSDIYDNLIEFDGEQHFNSFKRGFSDAKKHDRQKNNYCKKNNKILLRIAYTEENNIDKILDLFYDNNFIELKKFDIMLISQDINLNEHKYYSKVS